ncbi:MAG: SpoIIE family protein phosphatase [Bacteroidia bacterium]
MKKITSGLTTGWQAEMNAAAFKYHSLIVKVGLVLNLLFAVGDYFNSPAHFTDFLVFRIVNSLIMLIIFLYRDKLAERPALIVLIPVLGISIQNAYMYSVLTGAEFQKHSFAYIMLFIAAGMFILWKITYSLIVVFVSLLANIILFWLNSSMAFDEIMVNGGLVTLSVAFLSILLIYQRTSLNKKEIIARLALAESNQQLAVKNEIIEEKNKDIRDSINYALNIQRAVLPPITKVDAALKDYFILYMPKDIVSGDFYFFDSKLTTPRNNQPAQEVVAVAAVDCTGHGVPGALMSVIGSTLLNQTVNRSTANNAGDALNAFNKKVSEALSTIKDGMDMALCIINFEKLEMQYAGANNPIFMVREGEGLSEIKATKQAIGADTSEEKVFANNVIPLRKGDCIYLLTDGYADQFGGPGGKKFKYGRFKDFLLKIYNEPMPKQKELLWKEFMDWKGELEQVDDVLVIGIRV